MNKIEALRTAAKAIREGHLYNWKNRESCNCGVVAQAIIDGDTSDVRKGLKWAVDKLRSIDPDGSITWTKIAAVACTVTGKPIGTIFSALFDAGFTRSDIASLEYLSDANIRRNAGTNDNPIVINRTEKVIRYGFLWLKKRAQIESQTVPHYTSANNAYRYMDAWADILETQARSTDEELEPQLKETADRLLARHE